MARQASVVNLTPVETVFFGADAPMTSLQRSARPARCPEIKQYVKTVEINGHPVKVFRVSYGDTTDLPREEPGTDLVVSRIVAAEHRSRSDLLFPLSEVRDRDGKLVGCRELGCL
jgi:hypothetical protein